jgi:hypothetical protein
MIPQRKQRTYCLILERRNACYPRATPRTSRRSYFLLPNTEGAEIHKSMTPLKTEKVITKNFQIVLETQIIRLLEGK